MEKLDKKKPYDGHEAVYRKMKEKGLVVWGQKGSGSTGKSCRPEINNFLKDMLSQDWAPKGGKVIEFGCGTGPILRRVCKKGFSGLGIDVSKTAIAMAKEQSKGLDIKFKQGDVCNLDMQRVGKFDVAIDGLCLHCITEAKDRKAYLENVYKILNDGGLFVLLSMCGPFDKKQLQQVCKGHRLIKKVVYVPFKDKAYQGLVKFDDQSYLPSRYIGHWKDILVELKQAGFESKLIRYNASNDKNFCGSLMVGAMKI